MLRAPRSAPACLLMVASTVVWRRGDIFSGGLDPVVLGKALLSLLALVLAYAMVRARTSSRLRLGTGTLWFLGIQLVVSLLGALDHGTLLASGIEAGRVLVCTATVVLLLRAVSAVEFFAGLVWACGVIVALAAATGLSSRAGGRLFGGIPPLNPNELGLLAGLVLAWLAWRTALGEARWRNPVLALGFFAVLWATGSRTAMIMLLVGVVVTVLQMRRPRVGLVVGSLIAVAVGTVGAALTGALGGFAARGGTGTSTLDSRFIAWRAARTWAHGAWQLAFGGGLSVKLIPVDGQWWKQQLLDSSWVSALVQSGIVGLTIAAVWVLWVLRGVLRAPRPHRMLFLGMVIFLLGRSVLESGLFDATPAFLAFLAASLLAEGGSRGRLRAESVGLDSEVRTASAADHLRSDPLALEPVLP